jgi:hypothetical protein
VKRVALLAFALSTGCELFQPPPALPAPEWSALEVSNFGAMENVSMSERLWFGGGVTEPDIELAFRRGVKRVLDLSFQGDDLGFDLVEACDSYGIELVEAGLSDAESLSGDDADLALGVFRDTESRPLLVLCEAGSNSAAFFGLWRSLDHEMPLELALDEARRAGMRPGVLEEYVLAQHARLKEDD